MKKILLMLVAFVATMSAFAQNDSNNEDDNGWVTYFTPVEDEDDLNAAHAAQASDGSVYVSSTFDQPFTFAGKALPDTEGMLSSVILKYDKEGEELWAITLVGNVTITAMTADEDGTLYATGTFTDDVDYTGTDGVKATISYEDDIAAFVAKISKDGKFQAMKTFEPKTNAVIAAAEGPDPWGEIEGMVPLYQAWDPIYVHPNNIQIDGGKVYVSARYMGDVQALDWKGSYIDMFGMSYSDNMSAGVFSLNKSDLSGAANVATVQMTGVVAESQYYPEALNFVAENGTVYVGFFGFSELTLNTGSASKDYTFEEGKHPFVLAAIKDGQIVSSKEFDAAAHDKAAKPYKVIMQMAGDNIIIGGTFYGELPFNNSLSTGEVANEAFAVSVKKDGTVNWSAAVDKESQATALLVTGEEAHLATTIGNNYTIKVATGDMTEDNAGEEPDEDPMVVTDAAGWGNEYAVIVGVDDNDVTILFKILNKDDEDSAVEAIEAPAKTNGQRYNLAGQPVDENYKGFVIIDGKTYYVK